MMSTLSFPKNMRLLLLILTLGGFGADAYRTIWGTSLSIWNTRGGDQVETATTSGKDLSLDEKVRNAMQKLGLQTPPTTTTTKAEDPNCEDGVCAMPGEAMPNDSVAEQEDAYVMAERIASEMGVNKDLALAALGATGEVEAGSERRLDEKAARAMIQYELDIISSIPEDSNAVQDLVKEGHDVFLSRRALAFAEGNMEDARAILLADQMDAEEEDKAQEASKRASEEDHEASMPANLKEEAASKKPEMKSLSVSANFDPTAPNLPGMGPSPQQKSSGAGMGPPKPARKEDVVFEANTAQIQELVLESPVPVLLDCYAPWCGPCKALTPILEEMAVKAGGAFRLVKVNTDNERPISAALEVTALPTVYAIRDGKILNNFQGMPRSEQMMKNFMMGLLMPGATFDPPVTAEAETKFFELSTKLAKTAGAAGFSFSARESLQTRMEQRLEELVQAHNGDMLEAEESAKTLRSLMSNVIRDPFDMKYRRVNLENKKIATKVAAHPSCISILKSIGFATVEDGKAMILGKNRKVVNVSQFSVARDCIDKWIDRNRHKIAVAGRKRKDEEERQRLAEEGAFDSDMEEDVEEEDVDPNAVSLKVRLEGKKKVHHMEMRADDSLSKVMSEFPGAEGLEYQITCVAKKLIVRSNDKERLSMSLRTLGLIPTAALVVKVGEGGKAESSGSLKERVATQKSLKKGSHTMQSIGIYAKDDNAKGELIDGGGGVLYEQDVTDDEEEDEEQNENSSTDNTEDSTDINQENQD